MKAWAVEKGYDRLDLEATTERFFDYWRAIPGSRGVKLDWESTWRNWVRREGEDTKVRPLRPAAGQRNPNLPEGW